MAKQPFNVGAQHSSAAKLRVTAQVVSIEPNSAYFCIGVFDEIRESQKHLNLSNIK